MIYLICFGSALLIIGGAMVIAAIDVRKEMEHSKWRERQDYADQIISHCLTQIESE